MKTGKFRIIAFVVLIVVAGSLCGFRLIEYQIVNGDEYFKQASSRTVSKVKVNAARGKIVDRYGSDLVTNKAGFNLVLDRAFLPDGRENSTILALTKLLSAAGEDWVDDLPVTQTKPYEFLPGTKDEDLARVKKKLDLQSYATAGDCVNKIIADAKIEGYTEQETRTIAGVRYGMTLGEFSINNQYTFARDVSSTTVSTVEELGFRYPGVQVSQEAIRDYGEGDIVPHILGTLTPIYPDDDVKKLIEKGYALNDLIGRGGVEEKLDDVLRGSAGTVQKEQNSQGEVISETETVAPVAGNSVMLTIDKEFQVQVQQILGNFIESLQNSSRKGNTVTAGAAVVLDVKTGEVLALANYPTYKLSDLKDNPSAATKDLCLREIYRPGSTFKTVTATAGLSEGTINEGSTVYCNGTYQYSYGNGVNPKCTGSHGNTAVVNSLKMSCNIFFYEVGRLLGIDKLNQYANLLGLGTDTGFELYNEDGYIASPATFQKFGATWDQGQVWQAAIGQSETKVTPLQMAIQAMTIANKGTRYGAHIIKSVNSYDLTQTVSETQPQVLAQLSGKDSVFDIVQHGMREAANRRPTLSHFAGGVAIKTGTPQSDINTFNSTVVGFYPAIGEPEIAISVVLEKGEYSADVLEPIIEAYEALKAQRAGGGTTPDAPESSGSAENAGAAQ